MLAVCPAAAERKANAGVAVVGDCLTIVRRPEDVEAGRHVPVEEVRLGEAEVDIGAQGTERHAQANFLSLTEEIALLQRDVADDARRRRVARTEGDIAGALLDDLDLEVRLVGRGTGRRRNVGLLEEAKCTQPLLAAANLRRTEGIAFGQSEFAPDDLVQGTDVAGNVDTLDVDARPFLNFEGHIDGLDVLVAPDIGAHFDEGIAQRTHHVGQGRNGLLDVAGVVTVPFAHGEVALQHVGIQPLEARHDIDGAELVALAFIDGEGDEEAVAIGGELGDSRHHPEIGVPLGQVELAEKFPVEIETIGIETVIRRQEPPPGAFGRPDLAAQRSVAEGLVADKGDALDARDIAFVDLEDEIDAALLELDDLRLDRRVVPTAAAVDRQDTLDVRLDPCPGEHLAGPGLYLVAQLVVVDLVVTLEDDAIDDRIFRHLDHQGGSLHVDDDVRIKSRSEQGLQRPVGSGRIIGLPDLELQVGADGLRLGANIALNLDSTDHPTGSSGALGVCRGGECQT